MNLFNQVQAFSRGRYAAHLFTNGIHGEEEMVYAQKEWGMVELLFLLSLLAVRRMRHEYTRTMSKNADKKHSLEELSTLHPCFIAIFAVIYCYLKRCTHLITGRFCLSSVVSSLHSASYNRPFVDTLSHRCRPLSHAARKASRPNCSRAADTARS